MSIRFKTFLSCIELNLRTKGVYYEQYMRVHNYSLYLGINFHCVLPDFIIIFISIHQRLKCYNNSDLSKSYCLSSFISLTNFRRPFFIFFTFFFQFNCLIIVRIEHYYIMPFLNERKYKCGVQQN